MRATSLFAHDACDGARPLDQGRKVQVENVSIRAYGTDMAYDMSDHAMEAFGVMGIARDLPLTLTSAYPRPMRIVDRPSEVKEWVVARNLLEAAA